MTDFETRSADWLEPETATERILKHAHPTDVEIVSSFDASGRAVAEDIRSRWPLPPWDNSAMDGYAVRGIDIAGASEKDPVELTVIGRVLAGETSSEVLQPFQAIRIMTGGPIPTGADSVVRVEHTDREELPGLVRVSDSGDKGRNVRPSGQDWAANDIVVAEGSSVGAGTMGVLVAAGAVDVPVHRRPIITILATGDELFDITAVSDFDVPSGIPESNSHMVAAQVAEAGSVPHRLSIARDDDDALRAAITEASGADALVTIGGASMGEGDRVKRVLDSLGFGQDFWRVRLRPGTPFSFGMLPTPRGDLPVFGLPGNPASAFVTFEVLVRPFLRLMGGHMRHRRRIIQVPAGEDLSTARTLTHYLRVVIDGPPGNERALLTGHQGSGLVSSMGRVSGLAVVPAGVKTVAMGEPVNVMLLDLEH